MAEIEVLNTRNFLNVRKSPEEKMNAPYQMPLPKNGNIDVKNYSQYYGVYKQNGYLTYLFYKKLNDRVYYVI